MELKPISANCIQGSGAYMETKWDYNRASILENIEIAPRRTAARIALGYAAAGWLWILTSDHVVAYLTHDVEMMVLLNSVKGSLFVFVTAGVLFFMLQYYLKQIRQAQEKIYIDAQNLENAYEELTATDEELRRQYEEAKAQEKLVKRLAYFDTLTGLPNRTHLMKILHETLSADGAAGSLFYIDIDDLKMFNDSYGHSYGDALIFTAATHMVSIGDKGAVVARIGGDEFVVLQPELCDRTGIEVMAQELLQALSREYDLRGVRLHASVSIGIVNYPADGRTMEEILKNADTALHEAKKNGKRCWRLFRPEMQEAAYENMVLINGLRSAISNNELKVHYQPQVLLSNYRVTAFEALLRWDSPSFGNVSPARFIPLAEQGHIIEEIGYWVLRESCQFLKRMSDKGLTEMRVAVNVSPSQLASSQFIREVQDSIKDAGIPPEHLELEITESVLIDSLEEGIKNLHALSAMGVRLALDDFGTGYSSLTYLRQLPVNTVKIDKAFIESITIDDLQADLLEAIIHMSHVLGFTVVAEGVETQEQLAKLIKYQCDLIQGFFISKAVPEDDTMKIVQDALWRKKMDCHDLPSDAKG